MARAAAIRLDRVHFLEEGVLARKREDECVALGELIREILLKQVNLGDLLGHFCAERRELFAERTLFGLDSSVGRIFHCIESVRGSADETGRTVA